MATQKLSLAEESTKTLNAKIDLLGKKHAAWRDDVQIVLALCARNAFAHNNVDGFTRLVGVLGGADMKAIITWVEKYSPAIWQKKDVKFRFNKSFEGDFDIEYLMQQKWWEHATKPQNISSVFDVLEIVQAMLKRAEKEVNATTNIKQVIHKDLLDDVRVAVTKYEEAQKKVA
jgi:hypothetical protein